MCCKMILEIINLVLVFLTILIALFGEQIRGWFVKTNLKINTKANDPTPVKNEINQTNWYYHLAIDNEGSLQAKNVRVIINSISGFWDNKELEISPELPLKWRYDEVWHRLEYDIKESQTCDFIVVRENNCVEICALFHQIDCPLQTKNKFNIDIELIAKSDQGTTKPTTFKVIWDGKWANDIKSHITITKLEKKKQKHSK